MRGFWELLLPQVEWVGRRARFEASKFHRGDKSGTDSLAEDFTQETITLAATRAERWFVGPSRNIQARMRELLNHCLANVVTNERRSRERWEPLPATGPDALGRGTGGEEESLSRIEAARRRQTVLLRARILLNPGLLLTFLSIYFPEELTLQELEAAKAHRAGGGRPVHRQAMEAWALFEEKRVDPRLIGDPAEWKRIVAEIFRFESPFGTASRGELARAVNALDVQLTRAHAALERVDGEIEP